MLLVALLMAIRNMILFHPLMLQLRVLRVLCLIFWLWMGVPAVHAATPAFLAPFRHAKSHAPLAPNPPMPRCCTRIVDEFKPSYASVLAFGQEPARLEQAVADIETTQRITSCFTAWCSRCQGPYLLTTDMDAFPSPSAHHTHQLVLLSVLRESGAFGPPEPV